tara:strand:+ start:111 stop:215 length:105 start_codon:yes stop_codon:yes gene_type:complete
MDDEVGSLRRNNTGMLMVGFQDELPLSATLKAEE